jgi:hypothetical protein
MHQSENFQTAFGNRNSNAIPVKLHNILHRPMNPE